MTEAAAVPEVFNCRYKKSTIANYKRAVKTASESLVERFLSYGNTPQALMQSFMESYNKDKKDSNSISAKIELPPIITPPSKPQQFHSTPLSHGPIPEPSNSQSSATPVLALSQALTTSPKSSTALTSSANEATDTQVPIHSSQPQAMPPLSPLDNNFPSVLINIKLEPGVLEKIQVLLEEPHKDIETGEGLCPFCNEKMPESPSVELVQQRQRLEEMTYADPLPENPLHQTSVTGFRTFIGFCALHKFESEELPRARREGWPLQPNFGEVFNSSYHLYHSNLDLSRT